MFVFRRLQGMIRERRIPNRQRQSSSAHAAVSKVTHSAARSSVTSNDDSSLEQMEAQSDSGLRQRTNAVRRREETNRTSNENDPPTIEEIAEQRIRARLQDAQQTIWNRFGLEPMREPMSADLRPIDVVRAEIEEVKAEDLLPQDTYSFFATVEYWTSLPCREKFRNTQLCFPQCISNLQCWNWRCCPRMSFVIAFLIFFLQMATYSLMFLTNRLGEPPRADEYLVASQFFALFFTLISQEEVIFSLNVWYSGYDKDALKLAGCMNPSQHKWIFSNVLRFSSGLLGLVVAFILIVSSTTGREVLLNFTAVSFVSNVDNWAFYLAKWNYIYWGEVEEDTITIVDAKRSPGRLGKKRKQWVRFCVLFIVGACFFGYWNVATSVYAPPLSLYVQFSDEFSPTLGTFSGWYVLQKSRFGRRFRYVESSRGDCSDEQLAKFEYCDEEGYWAFKYGDTGTVAHSSCSSPLAHSTTTSILDLVHTASDTWFFRPANTSSDLPLRHFSVRIGDNLYGKHCKEDLDCCSIPRYIARSNRREIGRNIRREIDRNIRSKCASSIFCCNETKHQCVCRNGCYGPSNCLFPEPCGTIEVNSQSDGFRSIVALSTKYDILRNDASNDLVTAHERPVYVSRQPRKGKYDIILYTGRRWVMTDTASLSLDTLKMEKFHAHCVTFNAKFISEPADIGTPSDSATPVDKKWFHAEPLNSKVHSSGEGMYETQAPILTQPSNAVLLCAFCDDKENPCWYDGICMPDGNCTCLHGSSGPLCRIPPVGNGQCDTYFNSALFEYDGGDCCPSTCTSTSEHVCDLHVTRQFGLTTSTKFDGYQYCRDPDQLCDPVNAACFRPLVEFVGDEGMSEAHIGCSISLSRDGRVVAFYDLGKNSARVFEQDGRHWIERGEYLLTSPDEIDHPRLEKLVSSGIPLSMMALSGNGNVVATVWHSLGNVTSMHEHAKCANCNHCGMISDLVQAFEWEGEKRKWRQRGPDIRENSTVFAVSLSNTGDILAVAGIASASDGNDTIGQLTMYELAGSPSAKRVLTEVFRTNISDASAGLSLATSGDASVVAVGYRANIDFKGVKIYEYTGSALKPLVAELENLDQVEFPATALSEDGSTLAVATARVKEPIYAAELAPPALNARMEALEMNGDYDCVGIYRRDNSSEAVWAQHGQCIYRETRAYLPEKRWYEHLSLSGNGNILVIGDSSYMGSGVERGIVRIFKFDPQLDEWIKYPDDITGSPYDELGDSVALSDNGRMLATGSRFSHYGRGSVSVLWNPPTFNETEEHIRIPAISSSYVPITIEIQLDSRQNKTGASLTCNRATIAEAPQGSFKVQFQKGRETFWVEKGVPCEFRIAHDEGPDFHPWNGQYRVYLGRTDSSENLLAFSKGNQFYGPLPSVLFMASDSVCERGSTPLHVLLKTNRSPDENWEVVSEKTGDILLHVHYHILEGFRTTLRYVCVPVDECFKFIIRDMDGEGLCCNYGKGGYAVFLNGAEVAKGDDFGFERVHRIGSCAPSINCTGRATFRVEISTDAHGDAISWEASNNVTGQLVSRGGHYESGFLNVPHYFVSETCVSYEDCIKFNIHDSHGHGLCCGAGRGRYALFLDNVLKAGGRRFNFSDVRYVGNCNKSP